MAKPGPVKAKKRCCKRCPVVGKRHARGKSPKSSETAISAGIDGFSALARGSPQMPPAIALPR